METVCIFSETLAFVNESTQYENIEEHYKNETK